MIYCYICPECGDTTDVSRSMRAAEEIPACPVCEAIMKRDYQAEHAGTRGDYKHPIVMQSMSIMPDEVAAHRDRHPNTELAQVPGGMFAPVAHSLGEKRKILKDRGWVDKNSFV